jgi:Fe-S-cluster-containing hydrogenase component 2
MEQGPVVVIECAQEIPCNPCEGACRYGAIEVGEAITSLPRLREEKCIGCGVCVAACPGQAIFVVGMTHSQAEATVALPYEFLPLPRKGEQVGGLDREGREVCMGHVVKVVKVGKNDRTPVVTVAVPKECAMVVRNIAVRGRRKSDD